MKAEDSIFRFLAFEILLSGSLEISSIRKYEQHTHQTVREDARNLAGLNSQGDALSSLVHKFGNVFI